MPPFHSVTLSDLCIKVVSRKTATWSRTHGLNQSQPRVSQTRCNASLVPLMWMDCQPLQGLPPHHRKIIPLVQHLHLHRLSRSPNPLTSTPRRRRLHLSGNVSPTRLLSYGKPFWVPEGSRSWVGSSSVAPPSPRLVQATKRSHFPRQSQRPSW